MQAGDADISDTASEGSFRDSDGACLRSSDCDDGLACNGEEQCADGRCVRGIEIDCDDGIVCTLDRCDEDSLQCEHLGPDLDHDGHSDALCRGSSGLPLGDDCDDRDADRYPGNLERCDALGHDEDCDGTTLGAEDRDGDNRVNMACCNFIDGQRFCGTDCDDESSSVHPGAAETCNGIDDDCDGLTDDVIDSTVICTSGLTRSCTTSCGLTGVQLCGEDCLGWQGCLAPEQCNACDDDRNGIVDDGFECAPGSSDACLTPCGTTGRRVCSGTCDWTDCIADESCNYCDDDGDGSWDDDAPLARDATRVHHDLCEVEMLVGAAACLPAVEVGSVFAPDLQYYVRLLPGNETGESGSYWMTLPRLGFGAVRLTVVVEARLSLSTGEAPSGGWAVMLATDGSPPAGAPETLGIPGEREGISAEWRFRNGGETGDEADVDNARYFRRDPVPRPRGRTERRWDVQADPASRLEMDSAGWVRQTLNLVYTPNDPTTSIDEEQAELNIGNLPAAHHVYAERHEASYEAPEDDYTTGTPMYLVISAGTPPGDAPPVELRVFLSEFGYVEPTERRWIYPTFVEVNDHCSE